MTDKAQTKPDRRGQQAVKDQSPSTIGRLGDDREMAAPHGAADYRTGRPGSPTSGGGKTQPPTRGRK